jgi:thiopurine S-methyltransferase
LDDFQKRNPNFPKEHLHQKDFFKHEGEYDLIIEQTLFCAIDPSLRSTYAQKVAELLKEGGKLVGLFFNREFEGGPPFGGSKEEYLWYFSSLFSTVQMEECYNSTGPREGNELFIKIQGKI